jgi:uncharacterized protein
MFSAPDEYPELATYLQEASRGRLVIPKCLQCHSFNWPPRSACVKCFHDEQVFELVALIGTIYSWTVAYRNTAQEFHAEVPYVVAIVKLRDVPVRLVGLMDTSPDDDRLIIGHQVVGYFFVEEDGYPTIHWRFET